MKATRLIRNLGGLGYGNRMGLQTVQVHSGSGLFANARNSMYAVHPNLISTWDQVHCSLSSDVAFMRKASRSIAPFSVVTGRTQVPAWGQSTPNWVDAENKQEKNSFFTFLWAQDGERVHRVGRRDTFRGGQTRKRRA